MLIYSRIDSSPSRGGRHFWRIWKLSKLFIYIYINFLNILYFQCIDARHNLVGLGTIGEESYRAFVFQNYLKLFTILKNACHSCLKGWALKNSPGGSFISVCFAETIFGLYKIPCLKCSGKLIDFLISQIWKQKSRKIHKSKFLCTNFFYNTTAVKLT